MIRPHENPRRRPFRLRPSGFDSRRLHPLDAEFEVDVLDDKRREEAEAKAALDELVAEAQKHDLGY